MKNIVLARIDDRLIHGQILTSWVHTVDATKIVIIDDPLTKDSFMQRILKAAAPSDIAVDIFTIADGINYLNGDNKQSEKIIVLSKTPEVMEQLLINGINLDKIILGGMGAKKGRTTFNKNVSASPEEVKTMRRIVAKGVEIYYQLLPKESPMNIKKLLKEE